MKEKTKTLNIPLEELEKILDHVASGVYFVDTDRKILYWNKSAEEITGFTKEEIISKKCNETPLKHLDDKGTNLCEGRCPLVESIEGKKKVAKKVWVHTKSGRLKHILVRTIPMFDENGNVIGATETFDDISGMDKLMEINKKLYRLSSRDSLTNLYNKREMYFHLKKSLAAAKRGKTMYMIFIDLNEFKKINDECGHMEGDMIIKEFSQQLKDVLREEDMIFRPRASRFGGDEFVVIIETTPSTSLESLVERLSSIKKSLKVQSCRGMVSLSLGLTKIEKDDSVHEIIRRADKAMYLSKKSGKVVYVDKN